FKKAVIESYTDQTRKYSVSDLDMLIGERQRLGIRDLHDLTDYHLRFQAISTHLIANKRIGDVDQYNAYLRGFSDHFRQQILNRLHIKYPDHYLDDSYTVAEVYDAARFIIHAPLSPATLTPAAAMPLPFAPPAPPAADPTVIKTEQLGSIFTEFTKNILDAINQSNAQYRNQPRQPAATSSTAATGDRNTSCNFCGGDHYIRDCGQVDDYIRAGKCKRNIEGKVVLPSGSFVPRSIAGTLLRERIEEWHCRNPNQLAAGTFSSNMTAGPTTTTTSNPKPSTTSSSTPEHPFRNANDATYLPPQDRNFGAASAQKPSTTTAPVSTEKKAEPAYRTLPPIHGAKAAKAVYERSLDSSITLSHRELYAIAPELRNLLREDITTRRIPASKDQQGSAQQPLSTFTCLAVPQSQHRRPPHGATVISDPVETYLRSLRPGEEPDHRRLIVAKESSALRSIVPLIDNNQVVECILDPGCQIVAMSEEVCHSLSITYDPTIVLNMQSANGTVDKSLGLAQNVPFLIDHLTIYMQVHVIRNPAYDILLGRPFDVLTESIVRTYRNEETTVTVHDPNSDRVITVPTIPRGSCRLHRAMNRKDF
ncbi:hypothetical protein CPC08DRAFT_651529, partial [Agrocybe pediades]